MSAVYVYVLYIVECENDRGGVNYYTTQYNVPNSGFTMMAVECSVNKIKCCSLTFQASSYNTIEEVAKGHNGSETVTCRTKLCTTTNDENTYNVPHADYGEDDHYQDLPDEACTFNDGNYRLLDAVPESASYSNHQHHHVVDTNTEAEENQYHTLENDFEPCDPCVETQYHGGVESTRNNEPVYHTLEAAGVTEEGSTDTYYSSQCMNANNISIFSLSTGYVHSATEGSTDSAAADDKSVHQMRESGTDENPYHILEAEETSEYQALTDKREASKHVYQSLEQVTK